ncbi:MAG TPA: alkaline shock response membrane anchor protein AmaP [Pseudonocardiaceae bacterium]
MSRNRPARLNRTLLAVLGVVLLAAGGFAVVVHFGWWRVLDPDSRLIPGTALPGTVALYVTAAVAIILGLLCLRWLAAQLLVKSKTRMLRFEHDIDTGRTELAANVAIAPFLAEVAAYPGVHAARGTLHGARADARLHLVITADQDGDLGEIRRALHDNGLPRLRHALDLELLPVGVEFRVATPSGQRNSFAGKTK